MIIQTEHEQDPSDWIAIQQRIERDAPDIEVRIANNGQSNSVTARWQVRRPSLIFSPIRLINFVPRGGAVFCGHILGKDEQLRRLSSIGIAVPQEAELAPNIVLDAKQWGEYVIVKPNNSNSGKGVRLVRTVDVSRCYDELSSQVNDSFLVQPFIDHSEDGHPTHYRVLSLFGRALYCARVRWRNKRPPLAEIAADQLGIIASNGTPIGGKIRSICNESEIIALGERAHASFPECPVLGVDIIREIKTGRLYVLEVNPHGAVWHLSSPFAKTLDPDHVRELYGQFNALDRAAELLIHKTRADAS